MVQYVKEYGQIANSKYQEIAVISERTATRELSDLKSKGVLVADGRRGRGAIYRLKTP